MKRPDKVRKGDRLQMPGGTLLTALSDETAQGDVLVKTRTVPPTTAYVPVDYFTWSDDDADT